MASSGTSTALFPSTEPEAPDDGPNPNGIKAAVDNGPKPNGIKAAVNSGPKPKAVDNEQKLVPATAETHEARVAVAADADATRSQPISENPGREIVSYGVKSKEELPKAQVEEEPEEILELKTPGFIRVFGCDNCEDSDTDIRHNDHHTSSEESGDESPHGSSAAHHQPPHLIPVSPQPRHSFVPFSECSHVTVCFSPHLIR